MKLGLALCAIIIATPALSNMVVTDKIIRPGAILSPDDLQLVPGDAVDAVEDIQDLIGKEARIALYPGRPILRTDVARPALVDRNQLVKLIYTSAGLQIHTEGRALGRGAVGEYIPVMNMSSRTTVSGRVSENGWIEVE